MRTVIMLLASNLFMNIAWYWHLLLRNGRMPLWAFVLISWLLALPEYTLAVPANRWGHIEQGGTFTAPQLKIVQEAMTLLAFIVINLLLFRSELPRPRDLAAMALIVSGLVLSLSGRHT